MKIVSVNADPLFGLDRVVMQRLGTTVVLAGPNGGGKTRVLRHIASMMKERMRPEEAEARRNELAELTKALGMQPRDVAFAGRVIDNEAALRRQERLGVEGEGGPNRREAVLFVPKRTDINDFLTRTLRDIKSFAKSASKLGVDHLHQSTVPYIRERQSAYLTATHVDFADPHGKSDIIAEYGHLKSLIAALLGTNLDRVADEPALFGFPLHQGHLSDGQVILLQLAVALHAQRTELGEAILLLDEPETHLHPAALLDVLHRLRDVNPNGQLWIATHSLSVLAWAGHEAIWYVKDGTVQWAGKKPETVLTSLLGDADQIGRLGDLLRLPAQMASNRFAAECLLPPAVVETGTEDPQLVQIREAVLRLGGAGRVRVLDFGAGKGRLAASLAEAQASSRLAIDYLAFDSNPDPDCMAVLEGAVAKGFGEEGVAGRVHRTTTDLVSKVDRGTVDIVVLCNALHEIRAHEWIKVLGPGSAIARLLRKDGYLLVVEDLHIPTGEKAHQQGFLLLGAPELRRLFRTTEAGPQISVATQRDGRLAAHLVPAVLLMNVTNETRKDALELLRDHSREEVKKLREEPASYRTGELHGLYSQLFTNACLALDELS